MPGVPVLHAASASHPAGSARLLVALGRLSKEVPDKSPVDLIRPLEPDAPLTGAYAPQLESMSIENLLLYDVKREVLDLLGERHFRLPIEYVCRHAVRNDLLVASEIVQASRPQAFNNLAPG